jgi:hypothetical protein
MNLREEPRHERRGVLGGPVKPDDESNLVQRMDSTLLKFALPALVALAISATPAAALGQNCRFIQAKPDREACYKRQEEELAAKRKPAAPTDESKTFETLRQMRQDDDAVYRSINNICRGC